MVSRARSEQVRAVAGAVAQHEAEGIPGSFTDEVLAADAGRGRGRGGIPEEGGAVIPKAVAVTRKSGGEEGLAVGVEHGGGSGSAGNREVQCGEQEKKPGAG